MQLKVEKQKIKVISSDIKVSGSVNLYEADFEFSDDWNEFIKTAVFKNLSGQAYMAALQDDHCVIPYKAIAEDGILLVGVFGIKLDSGKMVRKPTVWADGVKVLRGCKNGIVVPDPDPDIYEQILLKIEELEEEIQHLEAPTWAQVQEKPFSDVGSGLFVDEDGALNAVAGSSYIHVQYEAADQWEINHNMGKFPSVTVSDSAGNMILSEVQYLNSNSLIVYFSSAFAGKAYLN